MGYFRSMLHLSQIVKEELIQSFILVHWKSMSNISGRDKIVRSAAPFLSVLLTKAEVSEDCNISTGEERKD